MTLHEAYLGWQKQDKQTGELYMKTRDAFRKTWLMLPTNKPCSYYTLEVLAKALTKTQMAHSFRVQAASVMIHVLIFAHNQEPDLNPLPMFSYNQILLDASDIEENKQQVQETPVQQQEVPTDDAEDDTDPLKDVDFSDNTDDTDQNDENMKKNHDKTAQAVVQLDPETLKPVKTWQSANQAKVALNCSNIKRAITNHSKSGGFYWCFPGEEESFKPTTSRQDSEKKPLTVAKQPEKASLADFSDEELIAEMRRRGWQGDVKIITVKEISI